MSFVKLQYNGIERLVNMSKVSEIYRASGSNKSTLFFTFEAAGEQVFIHVDETLDEIYEKVKEKGE